MKGLDKCILSSFFGLRPIFKNLQFGRIVANCLRHEAEQKRARTLCFVLMPDHLHFFCAPHDLHFGIDKWVEFWKRQFTRRHLDQSWTWQRKSFHHRLRDRVEYEEKLAYVRENPWRKDLVANADDWPFQGHIHDIRWMGD